VRDRFDSSTGLRVIFNFAVKLSSNRCLFTLDLFHVYRIYQSPWCYGVLCPGLGVVSGYAEAITERRAEVLRDA
jgi:hypothetical protein